MTHYIYALKDPDTKEVRYIGETCNMAHRYAGHLGKSDGTDKCKWIQCLKSNGKLPVMDVVEVTTRDKKREREEYWIAYFKGAGFSLLNSENWGGGREGAGRPTKYGEPVKRIMSQVPQSKVDEHKAMVKAWLKQFEVK